VKVLRWILLIFVWSLLLSSLVITPLAWIGFIIVLFGLYQRRQAKLGLPLIGNGIFKKHRWLIIAGFLFSVIMAMVFVEPVEETAKDIDKPKQEQKVKSETKEEKQAAAAKKKADEEKKAKEQAEKEEQEKQEAAKKQEEALASNLGLVAVTVSRVVDGDTIELSDGSKVRLIGVNTPESTTRHEEYGKEASNYTSTKLTGKKVWLQKDVSETDRYGRLLRVVWLAIPSNVMDENEIRTKMFNADLVLNGYAEPSTYQPDVKYSDYFVKFAREARDKNTGLWAYGDNGTTKGDLDSVETSTPPTNNPPATTPPSTGGTESYQNCTELRKVYPDGVPSTHPAYEPKHDRDKDNWACER